MKGGNFERAALLIDLRKDPSLAALWCACRAQDSSETSRLIDWNKTLITDILSKGLSDGERRAKDLSYGC